MNPNGEKRSYNDEVIRETRGTVASPREERNNDVLHSLFNACMLTRNCSFHVLALPVVDGMEKNVVNAQYSVAQDPSIYPSLGAHACSGHARVEAADPARTNPPSNVGRVHVSFPCICFPLLCRIPCLRTGGGIRDPCFNACAGACARVVS